MAMVSCRECGAEVSAQAFQCPQCGAPYPARAEWKGWGVDWKSTAAIAGWPVVHIAFGRDADGHLRVAKGIIAIGQFAVGLITIAQFGVGLVFGFGQFVAGLVAIGQIAVSVYFAIGQVAVGSIAIGQMVLARTGLAQFGYAQHLWSVAQKDPQAVEFFQHLARAIGF